MPFRPGVPTWRPGAGAGSEVHPRRHEFDPLQTVPGRRRHCTARRRRARGTRTREDSWAPNRNQSVTQLFYLVNTFHDHLAADPHPVHRRRVPHHRPAARRPELGRDPARSDPILAQALDGATRRRRRDARGPDGPDADHRNNASFLTLPDGLPGLLQTYLWMPALHRDGRRRTPFGAYDGANDASLVFHEYTHGLSDAARHRRGRASAR